MKRVEEIISDNLIRKTALPVSADLSVRLLILGSMPGEESLRRQEYYAHPRNVFWKIMGFIFDFDSAISYLERLNCLADHHVALWDVLCACRRKGSLDSNITAPEYNPVRDFVLGHPNIRAICCNGATAYQLLTRHDRLLTDLVPVIRLPTTSPAHAGLTFEKKLEIWQKTISDIFYG